MLTDRCWVNVCKTTFIWRRHYVVNVASFFRPKYNVEITPCCPLGKVSSTKLEQAIRGALNVYTLRLVVTISHLSSCYVIEYCLQCTVKWHRVALPLTFSLLNMTQGQKSFREIVMCVARRKRAFKCQMWPRLQYLPLYIYDCIYLLKIFDCLRAIGEIVISAQ